jgi:hypothetical protein
MSQEERRGARLFRLPASDMRAIPSRRSGVDVTLEIVPKMQRGIGDVPSLCPPDRTSRPIRPFRRGYGTKPAAKTAILTEDLRRMVRACQPIWPGCAIKPFSWLALAAHFV